MADAATPAADARVRPASVLRGADDEWENYCAAFIGFLLLIIAIPVLDQFPARPSSPTHLNDSGFYLLPILYSMLYSIMDDWMAFGFRVDSILDSSPDAAGGARRDATYYCQPFKNKPFDEKPIDFAPS